MRRMSPKPPIGGPEMGRPAKRMPPMRGKPIGMAPPSKGEGKRNYLVGSKGSQNATPQKKFGSLTISPKVIREMKGRMRDNHPYGGPMKPAKVRGL